MQHLHKKKNSFRFFTKTFLLSIIFLLKSFINSKIYEDYLSFEGCEPSNQCAFPSYTDKAKGFIRGLGPICTDEAALIRGYFDCNDRFFECGYINLYTRNNTMNPAEGVRILHGIDISDFTGEALTTLEIPESTINKLSPFFGLKGSAAANKLEAEKLRLLPFEADFLYTKLTAQKMQKLKEKFALLKTNFTDADAKFNELPLEIKTALLSQMDIYREIPAAYTPHILSGSWDALSHQIKSNQIPIFYKNGNSHKNKLRNNLDAHLAESVESHIQSSHLRGVFLIDLTNEFKADLKNYESYLLAVKAVIKKFMEIEKCENCKNAKIHEYSIIVYINESLLLTNFNSTANETLKALDQLVIPGSYAPDSRPRNTANALESAIWMFLNQTLSFDKLKTIVLFTNGEPADDLKNAKSFLQENSINLAVIDMSLIAAAENDIPYMAEGPYNYINYNFSNAETDKNQTDNINLRCLNKQVLNLFSSQNIFLTNNKEYRNSSMDHNNTVYFQAIRPANKNLRISINLNTFPEQNFLKMFVAYDDPFPEYSSALYVHEGDNYLPVKTVTVGADPENPELFKKDRTVYITLVGSNSNFGVKIEECDPKICPVGTNYNENNYPFPKWILVLLIIIGSLVLLVGIWYVCKNYRKKDSQGDLEQGFSKYNSIKN